MSTRSPTFDSSSVPTARKPRRSTRNRAIRCVSTVSSRAPWVGTPMPTTLASPTITPRGSSASSAPVADMGPTRRPPVSAHADTGSRSTGKPRLAVTTMRVLRDRALPAQRTLRAPITRTSPRAADSDAPSPWDARRGRAQQPPSPPRLSPSGCVVVRARSDLQRATPPGRRGHRARFAMTGGEAAPAELPAGLTGSGVRPSPVGGQRSVPTRQPGS